MDSKLELKNLIKDLYFFDCIHSFQMERAASFAEALREHYGDKVIEIIANAEDSWKASLGFYMNQTAKLINLCREKYGDEVIEILKNLDIENRLKEGANYANSLGHNSLEDIVPFFGESSVVENGDDYMLFRNSCEHCRVGMLSKELGLSDLMYNFHCGTDPAFVEGFNPNLCCEVRKTAMYDDCCEHLVYYKK